MASWRADTHAGMVARLAGTLIWIAAALLLLAPSAWFAVAYSGMPQLGAIHDDAVYWGSAQTLATAGRYEIPHLPEHTPQTKYPPLYPALLSVAWLLNGAFPENLRAATAVHWLVLPIYLWLVWRTFGSFGFSKPAGYALTFAVAAAPTTVVYSTSLMTEAPFTAAVLGALLVLGEAENPKPGRALAGGLLASAAFLIRSNGIALAVAVAAWLLWRRRWRSTALFLAPVLISLAGWQWWCLSNAIAIRDDRTAYYASYASFFVYTFSWSDLPLRLWINLSKFVESLGELALFQVEPGRLIRCLQWVIAAAAFSGAVTLFRRGARLYLSFAAVLLAMLAPWPYPIGRFVYPLMPLVLGGLAIKMGEIARTTGATWRRNRRGDRAAAVVAVICMAALVTGCAASTAVGLSRDLPAFFQDRVNQRKRMSPVYSWIRAHTEADATFAAYDDGLLYLFTGRRGYYTAPVMPSLLYRKDRKRVEQYVETLPAQWAKDRVTYILATTYDFRRDLHEPAAEAMKRLIADESCFRPEYRDDAAQVYRFIPGCLQRENLLTNRVESKPALLDVRDIP